MKSGIVAAMFLFILCIVGTVFANFPTHPDQVGLRGAGIDRASLPLSPARTYNTAANGAVISNLRFDGAVTLNGTNGITFRNCWFMGNGGAYSIRSGASMPSNVTLEDCDFGSYGVSAWVSACHIYNLGGTNYIRRCNLYNCADGIKFANGSINYVENCWIQPVNVGDKHTDCMQFNDGIKAKVYAADCTFEVRSFAVNGSPAYAMEEHNGGTVSVRHWGNSILQTKISGVSSQAYISFVGCLMAGGNYLVTTSGQAGQFKNNTIVRGTANTGTDIGLRDVSGSFTVSGNIFHDNGAPYTGGKIGGGTTVLPISKLNIVGTNNAAPPRFSPAAGTYYSTQSVTLSSSTSGASIYYTTNGQTPTTGSTLYTGAIPVSTTTTIKAIAVKSGLDNSSVAMGLFTIKDPDLQPLTIEAEDMTLNGYVIDNGTYLQGTGIKVSGTSGTATAPFLGADGTYCITFWAIPENDGSPTVRLFVGGIQVINEVLPVDPGYFNYSYREKYVVSDISISSGAQIKIEGTAESEAYARVDKIVFEKTGQNSVGIIPEKSSRKQVRGIHTERVFSLTGKRLSAIGLNHGIYIYLYEREGKISLVKKMVIE